MSTDPWFTLHVTAKAGSRPDQHPHGTNAAPPREAPERALVLGGGPPRYVLRIDQATGTVVVGERDELLTTRTALADVTLHGAAETVRAVRLRYHAPLIDCRLEGDELLLDQPFAGAAPGQSACLMDGDVVVGTATILGAA